MGRLVNTQEKIKLLYIKMIILAITSHANLKEGHAAGRRPGGNSLRPAFNGKDGKWKSSS